MVKAGQQRQKLSVYYNVDTPHLSELARQADKTSTMIRYVGKNLQRFTGAPEPDRLIIHLHGAPRGAGPRVEKS
jgi:hypothetical protein